MKLTAARGRMAGIAFGLLLLTAVGTASHAQDPLAVAAPRMASIPADSLGAEVDRIADFLSRKPRLGAEAALQVREEVFFLIGSALKALHAATGSTFPPRDTLQLVRLLDLAADAEAIGTGLPARALDSHDSARAPLIRPSGGLELTFDAPQYLLRSPRGWKVSIPWYYTISTATRETPRGGATTDLVVLSTLFVPSAHPRGHSQSTLLLLATWRGDTAAYVDYWLKALQVRRGDRAPDAPLAGATRYRARDERAGLEKEVITFVRDTLMAIAAHIGAPEPFEVNRPGILRLLESFELTAAAPPLELKPVAHTLRRNGSRTVILDVPFRTFNQGREIQYPEKEIVNPSYGAVLAMLVQYWGVPADAIVERDWHERIGWSEPVHRPSQSLGDLKREIDRGIPVMVTPAFTPAGHPVGPLIAALAAVAGFGPRSRSRSSGVLSAIWTHDDFRNARPRLPDVQLESVLMAARLVIGYDDSARVVIMHDPSFGPALEVPYDEFRRMWQVMNNGLTLFHPPNVSNPSVVAAGADYRPRSPSERAAWYLARGNGYLSVGDLKRAAAELNAGLAVDGATPELRHMLLVESGYLALAQKDHKLARVRAEEAGRLVHDSPLTVRLLVAIAESGRGDDARRERDAAREKLAELCRNRAEVGTVVERLSEFFSVWDVGCTSPRPVSR